MGNQRVNLTKRVKLIVHGVEGHRFCPVVYNKDGTVKPDYVLVNGKPEHHPEGRYCLDWSIGSMRKREGAGNDSAEAYRLKLLTEHQLRNVKIAPKQPTESRYEAPKVDVQEERAQRWLTKIQEYVEWRCHEDEKRRRREQHGSVIVHDRMRSVPRAIWAGRLGENMRLQAERAVQDALPRCAKVWGEPYSF